MRIIFIIMLLQNSIYGSSEIRSVIDIGTGKIKMQVARVSGEQIESLYCQAEHISLPRDALLNKEGMITNKGQKRIIAILKSLRASGESYGSVKCEAIATALFRQAPNGREIVQNISTLLGMDIKVISSEEEGILSFLTIIQEASLDPENIVVLDIGSGSFQITCKKEGQFLVYSAPFGRFPTHELVKNNLLSDLESAVSKIDPYILKKIRDYKNNVIGIGAHPKVILKSKLTYDIGDLNSALRSNTQLNLDRSDLLLLKIIMETLSINQVKYTPSRAGNTSGIFYRQKR